LPRGTELDDWQGRTLVSLVGFRFLDTRILGAPIPLHRDFDEVNLRFYVRRRSPEGWRRAVVFVREIVPRRAIAVVARIWYNEPYIALPMRHAIAMDYWGYTVRRDGGSLEYQVTHPPWRVWAAASAELRCDGDRLYGAPFARALEAPPRSAFVADGSPVVVYRGRRLPG
jgi:uncharacterized protein YqjF (DUF2071 family)